MLSDYDTLGIATDASPDQIKAAYHAKLKQFPAHTHPQEFKAIRAAYENLRKGKSSTDLDLFDFQPIEAQLDETLMQQIKDRAIAQLTVNLEEMIRGTF